MVAEEMPGGYKDGWSSWNPNNSHCPNCTSTNMEFYWTNGRPWGYHCKDCGDQEWDPK